jgi:hypothetical protein
MSRITNKKLAKLAAKHMTSFECRLLRSISKGQSEWKEISKHVSYDSAIDRFMEEFDLIMPHATEEKWILTSTGELVLEIINATSSSQPQR